MPPGPCTGQNARAFFLVGEQKEGIIPEAVHGQVEQDQQQEGGGAEEGGGENVVSDRESSDSDDGFTNVLDPLSRQAKELIANECQVLLLATSRSWVCVFLCPSGAVAAGFFSINRVPSPVPPVTSRFLAAARKRGKQIGP